MIISCAPFRISFVGGGSDIPSFFLEHGGAVLSCAIAKYSYAVVHPYFERDKYNLKYARTELVESPDDIKHPLFREAIKLLNVESGIEIVSIADVHSRSGLGSSSSFCVALLNGLHAHQNTFAAKEKLAEQACNIEIDRLGEPIGKQDQYASAMGGLNFIEFNPNGTVSVQPLLLDKDVVNILENNLMLFDTGIQRDAREVLGKQAEAVRTDPAKVESLKRMAANAYELRDMLLKGDCSGFGETLHANWQIKRSLIDEISSTAIDKLYQAAIDAGALGGKLSGAGGGGFLVLYCPAEKQDSVRRALDGHNELEFRFDWNGARIALAQ